MPKIILIVLIALMLVSTTVPSLFASPAPFVQQRANQFMTSPLSPLPDPDDGDDDSGGGDPYHRTGSIASGLVWAPQPQVGQMWIKTHQVGVGWWDAAGNLHVALQVNGLVKIPLAEAVMISIPRNAAGLLAPPGWKKMMRPENSEWVIVRIP